MRHVSSRAFPLDWVHREHRHGLFRRELNHPDNVFTGVGVLREGSGSSRIGRRSGDVRPGVRNDRLPHGARRVGLLDWPKESMDPNKCAVSQQSFVGRPRRSAVWLAAAVRAIGH